VTDQNFPANGRGDRQASVGEPIRGGEEPAGGKQAEGSAAVLSLEYGSSNISRLLHKKVLRVFSGV